ncbi:damage-inducible protein DinB [Gramella sp. GC03-9]|uniref:Damage-inducible protein DinB n=1 Tax=Christiangramia oceanisediminis TaxID=2920386 RepID=A0A9X2KZI5_9FLAO|nr:DinB family protein [Gramella oceanisediminis]MCP9201165.1 damage-inducible protein DinB [Gramella oceanisediminis]
MKDYFKELLEYSHFYNLEIIKKFNDGDLHFMVPERAVSLLSHTLNAQKIWNDRINGKKDSVQVWKNFEKDQLESAENENYEETLGILEREELDRVVSFSNSKGESYQNSVKDILFHIVNHSTYHRGQIATELRKQGLEPVVSDFVYYKLKK